MSDALVRTELRELVAEALEGNLGKDQMQSLLEALYLFESDGGADGLTRIAQSGLDSEQRHGALALMFTPPSDRTDWHIPPLAYDLAQEFLSTGDEQFQGSVIDILLEQSDAVAGLPSSLIRQICARAVDPGQRRLMRRKAQQLLRQLLKNCVDDPLAFPDSLHDIALAGLQVLLDEDDEILRLQFEEDSKEALALAIDRVHGEFEGDDWELLARAGRKLGIVPKRLEGPHLFWWPEPKTHRTMRMENGLVGFLPTMLAGFIMALLLSLLFRATDNQDTSLSLLYLLVSTGIGAVLGSAANLILPPIVLFPNRGKGVIAQTTIWAAMMAVFGFVFMYLLATYTEYGVSYRGKVLTRPFWESATILALSLSLIRPVTLVAHRTFQRRRMRYVWAIALGTLIPVGVLTLGVLLGVKDGFAFELQALYVGGPLAASLASACALIDNVTPDAVERRPSKLSPFTVGLASSLAGIVIVVFSTNVRGADETERSFYLLGEEFPLQVSLRKKVTFDVRPANNSVFAEIKSSSGDFASTLDLAEEPSTVLLPDDYTVCLRDHKQPCLAFDQMELMDRWRLMIEAIDVKVPGRSSVENRMKHVREGFVRAEVIDEMEPEDAKLEEAFLNLIDRFNSDAVNATGADQTYFLAREDNTIFEGASEWTLKKGSLVLRNSVDDEHYLTLLDGVRERGISPVALTDNGILLNESFIEIDPPESAELDIIAAYLSLAENPERYDRIRNLSAIFALENGVTFVGPPSRKNLQSIERVLSLAGAGTLGAGVYRVIVGSGSDDITLQLEAGWSYVGNPDFCHRQAYDNSIVFLPDGQWEDSLVSALSEMAAVSGAEDLFLKPGGVETIHDDRFCAALRSEMHIEAAWRPGIAYSFPKDQGQVMLETEGDVNIFLRNRATRNVETIYLGSIDDLVTLDLFEIKRSVNGEIESFCIQPVNTDACRRYNADLEEDIVDLPSPRDGFILPYWGRVVEGEGEQAAAFSDFIRTFAPFDTDATGMDVIAVIQRDVRVKPRISNSEGGQSGDQKQTPTEILRGSLVRFDEDGPRVLIGLTRRGQTLTGEIEDPGLNLDTLIRLDVAEAKREFPTLLRYVRELARWGQVRQPDAEAIGETMESLGIEQIQQGELIRQAAMSDLSEGEFSFESMTEMFAVVRIDAGVFGTLAFENVNQDELFSLQIPLKSDEVLCFASRGYAADCAHNLGLTWPVLMTDPTPPELIFYRPNLQDPAISSGVPSTQVFRLDTLPEDLNEFSVRGGDLVIELYFADGSRDWQDSDNLRDENGENDGEIVDLTRMTDVVGICVSTIESDGSCPNTISPNAPQLFPLLDLYEGLNLDRPNLQDPAISSGFPKAQIFRLDTWPEDLSEFSFRGGDLVIELYFADGSRRGQDDDNLIDENGENDGEIVNLTLITDVTGICVRTFESDGSCPNTLSPNAPQLFPLLDGGNEIVFDPLDNMIDARNRPQGLYWLPLDWVADQGVRRVRSDEYFEAVVRLEDGKPEKIVAERTEDGFTADVPAADSPRAVAICIERSSWEDTCDTYWTDVVEVPLRKGPGEINFIAQGDR